MAMPVTATVVTVAAAHTVTCEFDIMVAGAPTVTCQFAITVAAAHTGTRVTIARITELMDTHHSFRGIEFIDRFMLLQVTCPAIAPLVTRRTGVDARSAPHTLWLDS